MGVVVSTVVVLTVGTVGSVVASVVVVFSWCVDVVDRGCDEVNFDVVDEKSRFVLVWGISDVAGSIVVVLLVDAVASVVS